MLVIAGKTIRISKNLEDWPHAQFAVRFPGVPTPRISMALSCGCEGGASEGEGGGGEGARGRQRAQDRSTQEQWKGRAVSKATQRAQDRSAQAVSGRGLCSRTCTTTHAHARASAPPLASVYSVSARREIPRAKDMCGVRACAQQTFPLLLAHV